jgi:hypothetical protein
MTTLAEIHIKLQHNLQATPPVPVFTGVSVKTLPAKMLRLVFSDAKLSPVQLSSSDHAVSISGKSDFLGIPTAEIAATFTDLDDGDVNLGLSIAFPRDHAPGLSWLPVALPVTDAAVTLKINGLGNDYETLTTALIGKVQLDNFPIPFIVRLPLSDADEWSLEGNFESITLSSGLAQLTKLAGGDPAWLHELPQQITSLGNFSIRKVLTTFRPTPLSISLISFEVASSSPIPIIPDKLSISGVHIYLDIFDPRGNAQRATKGTFVGTIHLSGVDIDIRAEVPDARFCGALAEGSSLSLTGVVRELPGGISLPADAPDIVLHDLNVMVDVTTRSFSFYARCLSDWWVIPQKLKLTAVQVDFALSRDVPEGQLDASATISGIFNVGEVNITLSADHPRSGMGWQFTGSTGPGQKIPIGTLIDEGVKLFDPNALVPPALKAFTIENLGVSFNTASKDFRFTCDGKFKVNSTDVDCVVTIEKTSVGTEFRADVTVGALPFTGLISTEKNANRFVLFYNPKAVQEIEVKELVGKISTDVANLMPELTIGLKHAVFAYERAEKSSFLFGAGFDINAIIDTSNWGMLGSLIGQQQFGLENVRVLAASESLTVKQAKALNDLLVASNNDPLPFATSETANKNGDTQVAISKGFNLSGKLKLGNLNPPPLMLPAAGASDTPRANADNGKHETPKEPPAQPSTAKWIDIRKSLGPLYIGRVGFRYQDQKIGLLLDSAVDLAGLHVGLNGFQVRFPLQALKEPTLPELDLDGLELGYEGGPLQITGTFLRVPDRPEQYDGMALIKAANFMIAGLGSYATVAGAPSMFIYAVLHAELGGPPFFRVQGLAAGFGYNRKLVLPPIEEVHRFPLVRAALDEKFITKEAPIGEVLGKLRDYISPSLGNYWLAAGIRFSSFEMIQSFVLVSVSFGHEVEIGLLGLAKMSLPKGMSPSSEVAYAELALRVVIKPEEGTVAVEGRLTNASYILSKDCRLTGGFAFFLWSSGSHAGDFVVTLGGYHPKFPRPEHYPFVPRLGVNWQVSKELAVTAEMYFALTPSCLMIGGRLSAVYQSGTIKAWFVAYADFLLNWQPFYYQADMGISIGVQVNLDLEIVVISIRVELCVDLHLWGPPFSGEARVNLSTISFTLPFGEPKESPNPLKPDEFVEKFLPPAPKDKQPEVIAVRIGSGLIQQRERGKDTSKEVVSVVNAHALALTAESLIPSTDFDGLAASAKHKQPDKQRPSIEEFGIRPMGTALKSTLDVRLWKGSDPQTPHNLRATFVETGVPDALWGRTGKVELPNIPEAKIISATQGVYFSFLPFEPQHPLAPIPLEKLKYAQLPRSPVVWQDLGEAPTIAAPKQNTFWNTIWGNKEVDSKRNEVLGLLRAQSPFAMNEPILDHINQLEKHYFQSDPEFCNLGEQLN